MKKALSLLLAVLMLVSLFSGMAFADDDVIVEEPVAVDEIVGDDFAEAADAYVEEYTDEGSFEAADAITASYFYQQYIKTGKWEIEYMVPANPKCGELVELHCRDGVTKEEIANPTTVEWNHQWVADADYDLDKDLKGELGWETTSVKDATCTEVGVMHQVRKCLRAGCGCVEERDVTLDRLGHVWGTDPFFAFEKSHDPDATNKTPTTVDAILVMPTAEKEGTGHEACIYCGGLNPDTKDYKIDKHLKTDKHVIKDGDKETASLFGPWNEKVAPTCQEKGYKERICIVPGCYASEDAWIAKMDHTDGKDPAESMMVFDHIERMNCQYYAEVWVCSNPNCYSKYDAKNRVWVASTTPSQYVQFRGPAGEIKDNGKVIGTVEELKKLEDKTVGFSYLDEDAKHNTEYYLHHLYTEDWTIGQAAACCVDGFKWRACTDPGCPTLAGKDRTKYDQVKDLDGCMKYPIPALEPIYGDKLVIANEEDNGVVYWYHYKTCTRPECIAKAEGDVNYFKPDFGNDKLPKPIKDKTDPGYYTQANNYNKQVLVVDHTWGAWNVEVPVTATQRGHLFRTCTVPGCGGREDFFGNQAEFDAKYNPPHPVLTTGIIKDEDGAFKLYKMGVFDKDFTGIYDGYNYVLEKSGKWYVVEGIWENDAMGATLVGSTWYFLANGKVQEVTQLAEYQGKWFYVVNGVIDTSKTALVDYNGGKFVVALGRIVDEYSGLWQNAKSIGGDDSWYYVAKGQVQTQYTGLVQYNGEWFYVENGQLVPYNGEVEYDGEIFNVKEGMVVAA